MSSINFNSAATSALRTLQSSNTALNETQKRISTGLAIGEAKDNAAYWSIATTMQSDNKSLATVTDALGLGAATVDTAYQGLSASKDVLDEIKKKLTAALGSNVDRTAIQAEIDSLQDQLKSIANSSTFSGENWLSVNSALTTYTSNKTVVSSFTRDISGNVSIGSIQLDTKNTVLYDANVDAAATSKGILDSKVSLKDSSGNDLKFGGSDVTVGNILTAGLKATATTDDGAAASAAVAASALGGAKYSTATYSPGVAGFAATTNPLVAGQTITVALGGSNSAVVTVSAAMVTANKITAADIVAGNLTGLTTVGLTVGANGTDLIVTNTTASATAAPAISAFTFAAGTSGSTTYATIAVPTAPSGGAVTTGAATSSAVVTTGNLTIGDFAVGDVLSLTVTDGATATTYTTDPLTKAGGSLAVSDIISALNAKMSGVGTWTAGSGSSMVLTTTASATAKTSFSITGATLASSTGTSKLAANLPIADAAKLTTNTFAAVTLDDDDNINVNVTVGAAGTATAVKIDKALVDSTLKNVVGHVAGNISSADDMVLVMRAALTAAKVTGVKVDKTGTAPNEALQFTTVATGASAKLSISAVDVSQGADQVSVDNIDISDNALTALGADTAQKRVQTITAYINVVNAAINKVTAAATAIGAVGKRIDMQKTFVTNLMDTIQKGVSGLVDADMNAESTKLQALQVKQQLGVQALSIANQSAQSVLSLFRS